MAYNGLCKFTLCEEFPMSENDACRKQCLVQVLTNQAGGRQWPRYISVRQSRLGCATCSQAIGSLICVCVCVCARVCSSCSWLKVNVWHIPVRVEHTANKFLGRYFWTWENVLQFVTIDSNFDQMKRANFCDGGNNYVYTGGLSVC